MWNDQWKQYLLDYFSALINMVYVGQFLYFVSLVMENQPFIGVDVDIIIYGT